MWTPRPIDYIVWFTFTLLTLGLLFLYTKFSKNAYSKYIVRGYLIKATGGFMFAMVYIFYYGFGDTFRYYYDAIQLSETFALNPLDYFRLLATNFDEVAHADSDLMKVINRCYFHFDPEGWLMARLTSAFAIFTSNTYLGATFFFSFISFLGAYQIFKLSNYILKDNARWSFYIAFVIPSAIFWGGGILKDNYTLFATSVFIYSFYRLLYHDKRKVLYVFMMLIMGYLLYSLKAYIIICLIPWVITSTYLFFSRKVNSSIIRFATAPFIFATILASGWMVSDTLMASSDKYSADVLEKRTKGFRDWHKSLGGSYYDLGEVEYTTSGILKIAPKAISTTLFQPFPWEARTIFMVFNSLEGMFFMVIVLQILYYARLRFFVDLYKQEFLFGAFIFVIIFSAAVGMTSYNYGALARYKLPVLSPFFLILIYLRTIYITKVRERKREIELLLSKANRHVIES